MFDGENVYMGHYNPYESEIPIYGTDGSQFHPRQSKDDVLDVFIFNLYQNTTLYYNGTIEHNGLECYRHQPLAESYGNATTYPPNKKFWAFGPSGL